MRLTFLPFLLLIVPLTEISLFIVIGGKIGAFWTIGLVLFTAVLGSILLRIEGIKTFTQISNKLNSGEIPGEELVKGMMILIAGVLLLTPGFLTDTIGFSLFLAPVRKVIWNFLSTRFKPIGSFSHPSAAPGSRTRPGTNPNVVDLDPEDFHEQPNDTSPWATRLDDKKTGSE